jgi:hypothetical protein
MKVSLIVLFYLSLCVRLFAQDFEWAKSMGGTNNDIGFDITTDVSGNVYTTGYFRGTVDFDPGSGVFNLTASGSSDNEIFIQKLDPNGNFIWAKSVGGSGYDSGTGIAVDNSGNIYVTGSYEGVADFNPGSGVSYLTSNGSIDIFILKLDVNGDFIWAETVGGTSSDESTAISLDANGNVHIVGGFYNTVDFNPGAVTFDLTATGDLDIFILKLDTNGNFVWAKSMGSSYRDSGFGISVDLSGNVYTTGIFKSSVDFNPGGGTFNLTASGTTSYNDVFIQKLSANGNFVWAKNVGGIRSDIGRDIVTDINGNVYVVGTFSNTVDFNPGGGTFNLSSNGNLNDFFVLKLSTNGSFVWAKKTGGTGTDEGFSIAINDDGDVYTTGYFNGTVDFNPGSGVSYLTTTNNYDDVFIQRLDENGNFISAKSMGGTSNDRGIDITTGNNKSVYTTGYFQVTADFDPSSAVFNLISNNGYDIFLHKMSDCGSNTSIDTISACDSYTWIDGTTYFASNDTVFYTILGGASNGCDSIIQLNLTINLPTTGIDVQSACNPYTWIDGITYTSNNNTATDTLMNVLGCDSIVTLDLTILGANNLPYQENFTGTFPPLATSISNPDNSNTWVGAVWTATNGSTDDVMYIDYSAYNAPGQKDYFTLPLFDLDTVTIAELSFDVSYNPYGVSYSDSLAVEISTDCGLTYQSIYMKGGLDLSIDNSYLTSVWIPDNTADWRKERIDLSAYLGGNVLVRFVGINGYGNNLYLDNINVGAPVMTNVIEVPKTEIIKVYPTPTKDYLTIELIENSQDVKLQIVDVNGRVVLNKAYQEQSEIQLSVEHLTTGIYFVKIESSQGVQMAKMLKE